VLSTGEPATRSAVELRGDGLTLEELERVVDGAEVVLSADEDVRGRFERSREALERMVSDGRLIYGVNTGFGGMSDVAIPADQQALLQRNALMHNRAGAGGELPERCVRAAMALRVVSHLRGVSGLRWELLERLARFLNEGAVPVVRELGSIGASGDLVPLSTIARAVTGVDPSTPVRFGGRVLAAGEVLAALGLEPLELELKEGLAMVNGTAVSTGTAACCALDAGRQLDVTLGFHALAVQALCGSVEPFDEFVHSHKPHPGQLRVAAAMRAALAGSGMAGRPLNGGGPRLAQDRYSIRCLAQFLGPAADTVARVAFELETEINSANDNPLVDAEGERVLHCGNFLAQYVATGMDSLRAQLALMAKHVDAQLALLFAPEFSGGLPPSLVGNRAQPANMGLKALQVCGNSIMPLITHLAAPLADRFPTHAEQFNQNVNSQALGAGLLARQQLRHVHQHLAIALICAQQAVELRSAQQTGSHDPRPLLSQGTLPLYETICALLDREPSAARPYNFDDGDRNLEADIETLADDLETGGRLARSSPALATTTV
jgi:phenylalanine ammonia-lyase